MTDQLTKLYELTKIYEFKVFIYLTDLTDAI